MWRIIDLGGSEYYLHSHYNKLVVEKDGMKTEIPFQDIHSILCHGIGFRYSDGFIKACLHNKIPVTFCDEKHMPLGMLLPMLQHAESATRSEVQMQASLPRKKRAWQQIITAKLQFQSSLLEAFEMDMPARRLAALANKVLSGDTTNTEAQGAIIYFESLFGDSFFRSNINDPINGKLNYGYSILRSAVARAVVDVGLLPSLGVFHSNRINPFCLVDDLMEPYRPMVDSLVIFVMEEYGIEPFVLPREKKLLMQLTKTSVKVNNEKMEFTYALRHYVMSYFKYLARHSNRIDFPVPKYAWTI